MTGVECVEGMAAGLYEELFAVIVSLINRYGARKLNEQTNEPFLSERRAGGQRKWCTNK